MTAHWVAVPDGGVSAWRVESATLTCEQSQGVVQGAEQVADFVNTVVESFKLHPVTVTTDNCNVMRSAGKRWLTSPEPRRRFRLWCAAHAIQTCMLHVSKRCAPLFALYARVVSLVKCVLSSKKQLELFHRHFVRWMDDQQMAAADVADDNVQRHVQSMLDLHAADELMQGSMPPVGDTNNVMLALKLQAKTRWSSMHNVMQRAWQHRGTFEYYCNAASEPDCDEASIAASLQLSGDEWEIIHSVVLVMRMTKDFISAVEGNGITTASLMAQLALLNSKVGLQQYLKKEWWSKEDADTSKPPPPIDETCAAVTKLPIEDQV